ncbi:MULTISPECIES: UDP-2,4-diacetamido-2,4,6-trideoxy-beta-L-altropyranose hydrolase [Pseudoalteromonas]|uniref:UDP-2,4-diacetamido-2,4, 6-trideoxy-beta-L-altropyranose hydrolase n=1 Tax=Pseudoalteromonas TaxID=53246 RepID=UPI0015839676|nr:MULTISPECIES: UDP-2,4-diacetamido-2,4,6-trideoxy-beta-L-altropyranose hydrolase [Pseudoalteromonas]MDI4652863.1 UDP-2,4-diacetamido-2,4,6-trideoxy-beta-L-altropyranose hydrolase [Pseudoalteromonas shioyasakiensis]NUJ39651.1 UDP-2,4-diacetamido-2,4,6-trideoxy-beta-L-altropyranose hydrolase [Pseudoalteromonas sp. 0303]
MSNWFAIRCDASSEIGLGHAMRCLALAEWALEEDIFPVLFTRSCPDFIERKLKALKGVLVTLPELKGEPDKSYPHSIWLKGSELEDAEYTYQKLVEFADTQAKPPLFVVVDHYALGAPWERRIRKVAPILVIDDLSDRHHECDWLLDQTFGKSELDYLDLVPSNTSLMIGSRFALLRKEFCSNIETEYKCNNESLINVLISLGGADKDNVTTNVLKALKFSSYYEQLRITCVTSSSNPHIKTVKSELNNHPDSRLLVDVNNMAEIMRESDFCIGAPGSTTWERCAIGLPFASIAIADNQLDILKNLEIRNLTVLAGNIHDVSIKKIDGFIGMLMASASSYRTHVQNMKAICDGLGASKVLAEIIKDKYARN